MFFTETNVLSQSLKDTMYVTFIDNEEEVKLDSDFEVFIVDSISESFNVLKVRVKDSYFVYNNPEELRFKYVFFRYKRKLYYFGNTDEIQCRKKDYWVFNIMDNPSDSFLPIPLDSNDAYKSKVYRILRLASPGKYYGGYVTVLNKKQYRKSLRLMKKRFRRRKVY